MQRKWLWRLFVCVGLGAMALALTGCLVDLMSGNYTDLADPSGQQIGTTMYGLVQATECQRSGPVVTCDYSVGGHGITSTAYIVGADSALWNVVDPLILEVPDNVVSPTGTYDTGSGPQPLSIGRANWFPVETNHRITAEVNTTFLFLNVPLSVGGRLSAGALSAGPAVSYTLGFQQVYPISVTAPAVTVKPLVAGAITVLWQTYYIPLFPCIQDYAADPFGAIPAVAIPKANSPQDLTVTLGNHISHGDVSPCHFATYDYSLATPPPGLLFLPLARR